MSEPYGELKKRLGELSSLLSVVNLLHWDQETMMPPRAAAARADSLSQVTRLAHEWATHPRVGELLDLCEDDANLVADSRERANLREIRRDYERARKLPAELVAEISATSSRALEAWKEARAKNEFSLFRPWMEKQIELCRQKAECYGVPEGGELFDALIEEYEPGVTAAQLEGIFGPLREALTPLIAEIIAADPDFVWITTDPTDLAGIVGGAAAAGYTGQWAGNAPAFNQALLGVDGVSGVLDSSYTHFQQFPAWKTGGSEGMAGIVGIMEEYRPDAPLLSIYSDSYIMGEIARQGLEAAAANGDMTRQGVVDALADSTIDLKGMVDPISYQGDPNDFISRQSFVYDISLDAFTPGATVSDEGGDGLVLIDDDYTSPTGAEWEYAPCFPI